MKTRKTFLSIATAATLGLGLLASAQATPVAIGQTVIYDLNVIDVDGTLAPTPYATVALTQGNGVVTFKVAPTTGNYFANTSGKHFEFTFSLADAFNNAAVALTGTNAADFQIMAGTSFENTPFGIFGHAIDFADSIGNGLSAQYNTPLTFTVTQANLNIENFIDSSKGFLFAADLGNLSTGATLNVASSDDGRVPPSGGQVPEPGSLALIGSGLLLASLRRRKA